LGQLEQLVELGAESVGAAGSGGGKGAETVGAAGAVGGTVS
jgi:hypothetical protein